MAAVPKDAAESLLRAIARGTGGEHPATVLELEGPVVVRAAPAGHPHRRRGIGAMHCQGDGCALTFPLAEAPRLRMAQNTGVR